MRYENKRVDELLAYFDQRTAKSRLPRRSDIHPQDLKRYLPEIFIFGTQYDHAGHLSDLIVQLMGTTVAGFYGEITGQTVTAGAPSPQVAERILISCRRALETRQPIVAEAAAFSEQKNHLRVRVLYVPLSEDGTNIDRIFGHVHVGLRSETNS
ncbi:PAS domain-containing protein [Kordiimonas sp.]|uniref:PAS domain-containing protein n=1 Tax=Kordiimonas sp. TaxID=1970157 RepID=UPI003A8DD982